MCLIGVAWACRVVSRLCFAALRPAVSSRCRAFRAVIPCHYCAAAPPPCRATAVPRHRHAAALPPRHRTAGIPSHSCCVSRYRHAILLLPYRNTSTPPRHRRHATAPSPCHRTVAMPSHRRHAAHRYSAVTPCDSVAAQSRAVLRNPLPAKHGRIQVGRVVEPPRNSAYGCCVMRRVYSPIAGWLRNCLRALRRVLPALRPPYAAPFLRCVLHPPRHRRASFDSQ